MDRVAEALDIVVRVAKLGKYDCNVIGMAAEVIAEEVFGMKKTSRGSRDVDGSWFEDGRDHTVQVKAWSEARVGRYRRGTFLTLREESLPDVLLCLLVYCSKPGYEIIYKGPPSAVGKVEKNRPVRVIRFDHMRSKEEIATILGGLSIEGTVKPRSTRVAKSEGLARKLCSVCGSSLEIEQFKYAGRSNNSYCKACSRAVSSAYARGGPQAARLFRESERRKWSSE